MINPSTWSWPQWVIVVLLLLGLLIAVGYHGKPKIGSDGKPLEYNGAIALIRAVIWVTCLTAGGFFR